MPNPQPCSPPERMATILQWLTRAVVAMMGGERLPLLLIAQIADRLRRINQRFSEFAARVRDGRYTPRPAALPRRRPGQPPPPRNPLPQKFGWLLPLVPDAIGYRSQLEHLFRDPEMAALMEAAPTAMRRPLRSLCWMLGVTAPKILALPPPPPRPKPPPPPKIPRQKPEPGFSPSRPMGRVRYVGGLRAPPVRKNPA